MFSGKTVYREDNTMITITEANIISIDRSDETSWSIEGEITFEGDLATPFSATYIPEDDEFEDFEMELDPGAHDKRSLKRMIVQAAAEFED
ncbi:MAG: hypothetical protein LBK41_02620 [Clostridiales bacterium]|jgi:hypothetical protein|nr:hypothetical protein [Clostridiales bacterium]